MNTYERDLVSNASKLDAVTDSCGEITKLAESIVDSQNEAAAKKLIGWIYDIASENGCQKEVKQIAKQVKSDLVDYYGYIALQKILTCEEPKDEDNRSLKELLDELDSLVGLRDVKRKINDLIAYQKIRKLRAKRNLRSPHSTLHMAFTGNPGTGKTTVARIVGHIYNRIGLLSRGHFVEVSRTDLIAGYQGQTALKVKDVIDRSKGGVLFIDEAYSITENDHSDSYGRECLTELTKALEDNRDDLVVIVAGYTEPMEKFFESNPGLRSRFNTYIEFPDYSADELEEILVSICTQNDYVLDDTAIETSRKYFSECITKKDENFANGRLARNLFDDLVMNQARRVSKLGTITDSDLTMIKGCDFDMRQLSDD